MSEARIEAQARRGEDGVEAVTRVAGEAGAVPRAATREGWRETAAAEPAVGIGASWTEGVQDIAKAWGRYAEEVTRQTSEAGRALIRCGSLAELLDIQTRLMRGSLEAYLDQSSKITDIMGRMVMQPLEALKQFAPPAPR
jgi:hypothetical protein